MGNSLDSLSPDSLVEFGVQSHISGSHRFLGKVDHGFDGPGSSLFEGAAVHALVEMDGVLPGNDILQRRASLAACLFNLMSYDVCTRVFCENEPFSW